MDENEIAQRANGLPARYRDRLSPSAYKDVELNISVGEWSEGIENLIVALETTDIPITTAERQELADLMAAMRMPAERLDGLTIED